MNSPHTGKQKPYHCPRCGTEDIIDYGTTFDCKKCRLQFEKKDFDLYDEENILSMEEKLKITKALRD